MVPCPGTDVAGVHAVPLKVVKQYVTGVGGVPPLSIGLFGCKPSGLELSALPVITPVLGVNIPVPLLYWDPVVGASAPKKYCPVIDAVLNGAPICCSRRPEPTEPPVSTAKAKPELTK